MPDVLVNPNYMKLDNPVYSLDSSGLFNSAGSIPVNQLFPTKEVVQTVNKCSAASWCAKCSQSGKSVPLKLYQINFEEALYMCTEANCTFPLLEENMGFFIIRNSVSQMDKMQHLKPELNASKFPRLAFNQVSYEPLVQKKDLDLNSIINDIKVKEDSKTSVNSDMLNGQEDKTEMEPATVENSSHSHIIKMDITSVPEIVSPSLGKILPEALKSDQDTSSQTENPQSKQCISMTPSSLNTCQIMQRECFKTEPHSNNILNHCDYTVDCTTTAQKSTDFNLLCPNNNLSGEMNALDKPILSESNKIATQTELLVQSLPDTNSRNAVVETVILDASDSSELSIVSRYPEQLQWQNENLCWLDVLLHCVVNSTNLRATLNSNLRTERPDQILHRLCKTYDETQDNYSQMSSNDSSCVKQNPSETTNLLLKLHKLRQEIVQILQCRFALTSGVHESVLEMFSNLIKLNPAINALFSVQIRWDFECDECNHRKMRRVKTNILSFPATTPDFHPLNAMFLRSCFKCSAQSQTMGMVMETIPPCIAMHFQEGLPHNRLRVLDFGICGHLYSVYAVIQHITTPFNHFVVWIKDCTSNKWMCCDNLQGLTSRWQSQAPKIPPRQIHMVIWEKQGLNSPLAPSQSALEQRQLHLQHVRNEEALIPDYQLSSEETNGWGETIVVQDNMEVDSSQEVANKKTFCTEFDEKVTKPASAPGATGNKENNSGNFPETIISPPLRGEELQATIHKPLKSIDVSSSNLDSSGISTILCEKDLKTCSKNRFVKEHKTACKPDCGTSDKPVIISILTGPKPSMYANEDNHMCNGRTRVSTADNRNALIKNKPPFLISKEKFSSGASQLQHNPTKVVPCPKTKSAYVPNDEVRLVMADSVTTSRRNYISTPVITNSSLLTTPHSHKDYPAKPQLPRYNSNSFTRAPVKSSSASFREMRINTGPPSSKLSGSGAHFEPYKRRKFKLAGYDKEKASLKANKYRYSTVKQTPYEAPKKEEICSVPSSQRTLSRSSVETASDLTENWNFLDFDGMNNNNLQDSTTPSSIATSSITALIKPCTDDENSLFPFSLCSTKDSVYGTPVGSVTGSDITSSSSPYSTATNASYNVCMPHLMTSTLDDLDDFFNDIKYEAIEDFNDVLNTDVFYFDDGAENNTNNLSQNVKNEDSSDVLSLL